MGRSILPCLLLRMEYLRRIVQIISKAGRVNIGLLFLLALLIPAELDQNQTIRLFIKTKNQTNLGEKVADNYFSILMTVLKYLQSKLICLSLKEREMNKKSAKRRRKDLIAKLAVTSALTLGVGAAATMTGQTEVRADSGRILGLDMTNQEEVDKFAEKLKSEVQAKYRGSNSDVWQRLSLILNGYRGIKGKIETELKESQQKVQELNNRVESETQEKQKLQEQLDKEKEQLEALKKELETEKAKEAEEADKLQKQIAEKDATISDLQKQLEASNQKVKELEAEKAALQEKLAMQEQAHAEEKAKLQKEIEELKAQIEKLKHCQDTPKPEPKPMPEPKPEPKPMPEPKPEPKPMPEPKPEPKPMPEPKPEAKKPEQPKPMTKPGAKKPEQSLPSTGDIRNPFFTPAAIAIMIAAGTIAIPKRKKED